MEVSLFTVMFDILYLARDQPVTTHVHPKQGS